MSASSTKNIQDNLGVYAKIASRPRVSLTEFPTPLEPARTISQRLGRRILVKRDDVMNFALGGNKVRKLEFLMGDAIEKHADTIVTTGAQHSNHARLTAAAAVKMRLKSVLVLRGKPPIEQKGNLLLDRLLGAEIRYTEDPPDATMKRVADELRQNGGSPYVIPAGGANSIGTLGYVNAAREIIVQAKHHGLRIDQVVHATGTGPTQAGLIIGFHVLGSRIKVVGVSNGPDAPTCKQRVRHLVDDTVKLLGVDLSIPDDEIIIYDDYTCGGYGVITREVVDSMTLAARSEGLILDPVYTGKAMLGLRGLIE
ncbi:MAG TPA: D-cysteine desulfhydrase family protein, partial [Candidatus Binatus sp.]|nr:D-cysteine desulfhydrase family protein [Candidatus Binatus sp.]